MRSRFDAPDARSHAARTEKRLSVASVTVAYNGTDILRRHLESLRQQTRKLDEIIVVDNASTDDTRRWLTADYPEVTLLPLSSNGGIAGGLYAGLAYAALEKRYDWIWLFDQDSVPAPDALGHLLLAARSTSANTDDIAIFATRCLHPESQMHYPGLAWRGSRFIPIEPSADVPLTFVDMTITSGSLIQRPAVEKVGLPRTDFFMDFVDYEHCLRLRRNGFRIAIVHDSTLHHAIGSPTTFRIFGHTKSWADHAPWREYYMARNEIFTIWSYYREIGRRLFVLRRLAHHAFSILLFGRQKLDCLRMMCHGIRDGLSGRLGVRFLPNASEHSSRLSLPSKKDVLSNFA